MVQRIQTRTALPDALGIFLREIRRIPLLTLAEERALARRVKEGDEAALEALVRHNLRFVVSVAKRYAGAGVPFEDLVNEGNMGLLRAARRFDVDRGYRFISYAVWWIRQAILQHLAEQSRLVRLPLNKTSALTRLMKEQVRLGQELGREPTHEELAARVDLRPEAVERILHLPTHQFSIDDPGEGRDNDFYIDTLSDQTSPAPDVAVIDSTRDADIAMALASLSPREGDILKRYFGLAGSVPHTLEEIGRVYSLTRERVRQIRDRAITRLRESPYRAVLWEHSNN